MSDEADRVSDLVALAKRLGATKAKAIRSEDIVVDERVRLKCTIPLCDNYNRHLLCPPNLMSVEEFRKALSRYRSAVIIQLDANYDSTDKSSSKLTLDLQKRLRTETHGERWEKKLHTIVSEVEAAAFKKGFYLAAGLIGSDCTLCPECVGKGSSNACKHPFLARPSMQAMGIDVIKTSRNAGMPVTLSSTAKVRWTGLILLE